MTNLLGHAAEERVVVVLLVVHSRGCSHTEVRITSGRGSRGRLQISTRQSSDTGNIEWHETHGYRYWELYRF